MPLKGFVEEARKTNKKMELIAMQKQNLKNVDNIIDISDGQNIPKEKLNEIRTNNSNISNIHNSKSNFNYINNSNKFNNKNNFEISKTNNSLFPRTDFEKEYLNRQKNQINQTKKEFLIPNGTEIGKNSQNLKEQKIESKHGNIIANVIKKSGNQRGQKAPWQECKYLKKDAENFYCTEFHCFCKKDACPFSCK